MVKDHVGKTITLRIEKRKDRVNSEAEGTVTGKVIENGGHAILLHNNDDIKGSGSIGNLAADNSEYKYGWYIGDCDSYEINSYTGTTIIEEDIW